MGGGRGGRKDAAEVKKTKTERAASEKDKSSRWRMKATVSQQDGCGFGGGQDGLNAVRHCASQKQQLAPICYPNSKRKTLR